MINVNEEHEVIAGIIALKAKHAALRQANCALIPATLERIFSGGR